jgi:ParB family transcriptional regulator, chromosome partitioning protein
MIKREDYEIHMIPIDQILILNPRQRGKMKFQQIVENIAKLGLKKPITVARNQAPGELPYLLVCGQGRIEAFKALGETEIPAVIIDATKEEQLLMSLIENLARRQHTAIEMVRQIKTLKERGYRFSEIAEKTDLTITYVRGIVKLLDQGEERLLQAVEKGQIPVSIAVTIASSDDQAVQAALKDAYEKNDLRGKALLRARRLVDSRKNRGKSIRRGVRIYKDRNEASKDLLKTYRDETARQRIVIQKSKICETRLLFVVSALKQLFRDENFVNLLRAEGLDTLPQFLADRIDAKDS